MPVKQMHIYDMSKIETDEWRRAMYSQHGLSHKNVVRIIKNAVDYVKGVHGARIGDDVEITESLIALNSDGATVYVSKVV